MGLIADVAGTFFGRQRNVVAETFEVFRENAEASGERAAAIQSEVMRQFAAEFGRNQSSLFDRFIDGVNRLPRPMMALGTLALLVAAMVDPVWFAARMQGLALVPEPLWWLMGAVVSFYFGARYQAKGQEFQKSIAQTMARTGEVTRNIAALEQLGRRPVDELESVVPDLASVSTNNPALKEWQAQHGS